MSGSVFGAFFKLYERHMTKLIRKRPKPKHIGIIMDGNRRFANEFGINTASGHSKGARRLEDVLGWCWDIDIQIVTVYAFSTENIRRSEEEVNELMNLFEKMFNKVAEHKSVHKRQVKINAIGDLSILPTRVQESIERAQQNTKNYNNFILNIAIGYGGREEIVNAVKKIARDYKENKISENSINEGLISKYLYTSGLPDPDLIIRTSGEERLSGFLLWQSAYSELYFCDTFWPTFKKIDFLRAIKMYQQRKRRYGE